MATRIRFGLGLTCTLAIQTARPMASMDAYPGWRFHSLTRVRSIPQGDPSLRCLTASRWGFGVGTPPTGNGDWVTLSLRGTERERKAEYDSD